MPRRLSKLVLPSPLQGGSPLRGQRSMRGFPITSLTSMKGEGSEERSSSTSLRIQNTRWIKRWPFSSASWPKIIPWFSTGIVPVWERLSPRPSKINTRCSMDPPLFPASWPIGQITHMSLYRDPLTAIWWASSSNTSHKRSLERGWPSSIATQSLGRIRSLTERRWPSSWASTWWPILWANQEP